MNGLLSLKLIRYYNSTTFYNCYYCATLLNYMYFVKNVDKFGVKENKPKLPLWVTPHKSNWEFRTSAVQPVQNATYRSRVDRYRGIEKEK